MIRIKTYNDLLEVGENEKDRMDFVLNAINEHKSSRDYITASYAELYYKHQNPTIMRYQKFVHNQLGQKVPNVWSANNKIASNWFNYFTTQAVSYLLGNGVMFTDDKSKDRLGKDFDKKVQDAAIYAKIGAVSFGFWNLDHVEVFALTEFAPLWDEDDGGLKAGIRFWQIDDSKPLRATLYEMDGYTDYIKRNGEDIEILVEKRPYKETYAVSKIDGEQILNGENYPGFPIVPLWNVNRQSDLIGNRGTIDAYDLMVSGLINNVSDGEFLYWILTNCDGMSEMDVVQFIEQMALTHVAQANGSAGAKVESHQATVPFEATAEALDRLKTQLYKDFMALRVEDISAGSVTATQIQAAYEPINQKTDQFEFCVTAFVLELLRLAGIDDEPSYTRSQMSNQTETVNMVLAAASYLDEEYVTQKILTLFGDIDQLDEVMKRRAADALNRYVPKNTPTNEPTEE